jgi:hypothetical protein
VTAAREQHRFSKFEKSVSVLNAKQKQNHKAEKKIKINKN